MHVLLVFAALHFEAEFTSFQDSVFFSSSGPLYLPQSRENAVFTLRIFFSQKTRLEILERALVDQFFCHCKDASRALD
jgi:hypothetical protein